MGSSEREHEVALMEGHLISAADEYFKARHEMLDTLDRRRVYEAAYKRAWDDARGAQASAEPWKVGDRVTCDFHHGIPATITRLLDDEGHPGGFAYQLDRPHSLGPRHGYIENGQAFDTSRWHRIAAPQQAPLTPEQRCALVGIPSMLEDYVAAIQKTKDFGAMYFIPDIADAHEALVALLRAHGISAGKEKTNG